MNAPKRIFAVENAGLKKEQHLLIYSSTKKLLAVGQVVQCKPDHCLGRVIRASKGFVLDTSLIFSTEKLTNPSQKAVTATPKTNNQPQEAYFGIGGAPLSYGVKLGYRRGLNEKSLYGLTLGLIANEVSKIKVSGFMLGGNFAHKLIEFSDLSLMAEVELGLLKADLEFMVDNLGPEESSLYYYGSLAGNLVYAVNSDWSLLGGLGYSLNSFKESYENEVGDSYNVPFSGGSLFVQMGLSYRF